MVRGGAANIDGFRREYKGGPNILDWISDYLGQGRIAYDPWLSVEGCVHAADVVVHRSPRYRNELFPWGDAVALYAGRMAVVGSPEEHKEFCQRWGEVPYRPTRDYLELAQVIAGARLFIGNQSSPMAVALDSASMSYRRSAPERRTAG